jgi:hypothetical protein
VKGEQYVGFATLEGKLDDIFAELSEGMTSCQEILLPELFCLLYAGDGILD